MSCEVRPGVFREALNGYTKPARVPNTLQSTRDTTHHNPFLPEETRMIKLYCLYYIFAD